MSFIKDNLKIIADCILLEQYRHIETNRFELKDLSAGWGDDWYKTVCSFLNTNGGVIIIGIQDKANAKPPYYKFTGYTNSEANENHLKQDLPKKFTDRDGKTIEISEFVTLEIQHFLNGSIAIVYVQELPVALKYAFYKEKAYTRKLTGDHILTNVEIERFEEVKGEVMQAQELSIVKQATIDDIDLEALNTFIYEYNKGKKRGETLKKSTTEAMPFLHKQGFMRDNQITILGMLVAGNEPQQFLQGRAEADCYVIMPKALQVAADKEVIEDNIIELMKRTQSFVWRNIKVGVGYANGGTALPEYPEMLIRESINNAFAHRDYISSKFVIVEIRPQQSLMIQNPGHFERRQRIAQDTDFGKVRRIIPLQVSRNPKLTHLLKSFDYWEGKGRGMASLIDACLDNQIDVPYYILSQDDIKLFIRKGEVFDAEMQWWLAPFSGYIQHKIKRQLSISESMMLAFFKKSEDLNRLERYTVLITADNNHLDTIATLEALGLVFKNPVSPEFYPIYHVDRTLMKTSFSTELALIFRHNWEILGAEGKEVLEAIYLQNHFGNPAEATSANHIGTFLYFKKNKKVENVKDFDNFKRKIRNIFNQLENQKFITRKDGRTKQQGGKPDFKINETIEN